MNIVMLIKIILGLIFLITTIVLIIVAFKQYYKYLIQEKKCKNQVLGIITGYTILSRGNKSGVSPSIVEYEVDGKKYKVIGPEYKEYKVKTIYTPLSNGLDVEYIEEGSKVIRITQKLKSIINFQNPMKEIYPLGAQVSVYYDEKNPKLAYVSRYCDKKNSFWFTILASVIILLLGIILIISI